MRSKLLLPVMLVLLGCTGGEQEIVVLQEENAHYILVLFNQKSGVPESYNGKKRLYKIPSTGILKTQFGPNDGFQGLTEFYIGEISPKKKIPSALRLEDISDEQSTGFIGSAGSVKKSEKSNERVRFLELFVGTKSEIKKAMEEVDKMDIAGLADP